MNPLFFIHVTKTAGGTIKKMLREGDLNIQFHYPGEHGFSKDFSYSDDFDAIYGHYRFGAHEIMGVDPNYACFVRNPFSRTVSHFYHLKNVAKNAAGDKARQFGDIGSFLSNTKSMDLDNLQTRMISGIGRDIGYQKLDQLAADLAIDNLRRYFRFIGVFEDLASSIDRLNALLPGLKGSLAPHVNKGSYSDGLSEESIELINLHNSLDMQVYDEAVRLSKSVSSGI